MSWDDVAGTAQILRCAKASAEFRAAGLPTRVVNALVYSAGLAGIADLLAKPWGDLEKDLLRIPRLGPQSVATVGELVARLEAGRD